MAAWEEEEEDGNRRAREAAEPPGATQGQWCGRRPSSSPRIARFARPNQTHLDLGDNTLPEARHQTLCQTVIRRVARHQTLSHYLGFIVGLREAGKLLLERHRLESSDDNRFHKHNNRHNKAVSKREERDGSMGRRRRGSEQASSLRPLVQTESSWYGSGCTSAWWRAGGTAADVTSAAAASQVGAVESTAIYKASVMNNSSSMNDSVDSGITECLRTARAFWM